jgi:hypothetical protein
LIEKIKNAPSLALLILAALQLGRRVAVKVAEEIWNKRGQTPDEGGVWTDCAQNLEHKELKRRDMMTLLGLVKWRRRLRGCRGSLLRQSQANEVLAGIEATFTLAGLPDAAHQALTNLYNYLDKHRDHIDYAKFKELGLPIGTGMVESACKWLIQQRFKGVGMRWGEGGFNHLRHLRLAWVNGRFDELFPLTVPPTNTYTRGPL